MQQFDLSFWLQDKSRKVVTRRGNPVRIICTDRKHGEDDLPIVFLEENNGGEFLLTCRNDGRCDIYETQYDLFFADEEEGLTEFEKAVSEFIQKITYNGNVLPTKDIKEYSKSLLDLARNEIRKEQQEKLGTLEMPIDITEPYYIKGKQDALKDLPKLEKTKDVIDPTIPIMYTNTPSMKSYIEYHGYKLCINDVFEKLPKEE